MLEASARTKEADKRLISGTSYDLDLLQSDSVQLREGSSFSQAAVCYSESRRTGAEIAAPVGVTLDPT